MTADQLKAFCAAKLLSQKELATLLGTSPQNITNWIKGKHDIPSWVEKELYRTVKIPLPIEDLHALVEYARRHDQPLESLLAEAIRDYLTAPSRRQIIEYRAEDDDQDTGNTNAAEDTPDDSPE